MKRISGFAAALAIGCAAVAPAGAQVIPEPSATDVAKTPLRDLNLDKQVIHEALILAENDPYRITELETCNDIVTEIAALDSILGADYDIAEGSGRDKFSEGRIGQSVVGSLIPFRGIVREVTGAAGNERALQAAYTAGMVRRAFLKGWGLGRGCAYPARPKATEQSGK